MHDIIIVGGGPAGLTAAVYGLRAGKSVLVIEKNGFGGQIAYSPKVENIPGTKVIGGAEFAVPMWSWKRSSKWKKLTAFSGSLRKRRAFMRAGR